MTKGFGRRWTQCCHGKTQTGSIGEREKLRLKQAAKFTGCHTIIAVDRIPRKLDLAKELGATHIINTNHESLDLVKKIRDLTPTGGSNICIDTTAAVDLIKKAWEFTGTGPNPMSVLLFLMLATATRGKLITVGIPAPGSVLEIDLLSFLSASR